MIHHTRAGLLVVVAITAACGGGPKADQGPAPEATPLATVAEQPPVAVEPPATEPAAVPAPPSVPAEPAEASYPSICEDYIGQLVARKGMNADELRKKYRRQAAIQDADKLAQGCKAAYDHIAGSQQ